MRCRMTSSPLARSMSRDASVPWYSVFSHSSVSGRYGAAPDGIATGTSKRNGSTSDTIRFGDQVRRGGGGAGLRRGSKYAVPQVILCDASQGERLELLLDSVSSAGAKVALVVGGEHGGEIRSHTHTVRRVTAAAQSMVTSFG